MNGTSWSALQGTNTLLQVTDAYLNASLAPYSDASQLLVTNDKIEVFDLVVNNLDDGSHPFHLHGHTFWIMDSAEGEYTGNGSFTTKTPMRSVFLSDSVFPRPSLIPLDLDLFSSRRDTVIIPAYSYTVIRFITDNPGLWIFHCHIVWHMETGPSLSLCAPYPSLACLPHADCSDHPPFLSPGLAMQFASLPSHASVSDLVASIPSAMRDQCASRTATAFSLARQSNPRLPRRGLDLP